jgi:hypothetical protein
MKERHTMEIASGFVLLLAVSVIGLALYAVLRYGPRLLEAVIGAIERMGQ